MAITVPRIAAKGAQYRQVLDDLANRDLVIFDFDGTLADTMPGITQTARKVFTEIGMTEEEMGDIRRIVGPPFPYAFEMVYGMNRAQAEAVTKRYREIYAVEGTWPLFEGIYPLLDDLKRAGKLVAIASSKKQDLVLRGVKDNRLEGVLDACVGRRDEAESTKVQAIADVMNKLQVDTEHAVMVGDRMYDIDAARPNDVPCVGVLYGNTTVKQELIDHGAAAIVDNVPELHHVLLGA
ncbi:MULTISPECIES: HAD family hydrolase [Atopobiaceae]|uniref:HAD family hydrolase n=1 Tax=Atopobiaceae TaxID=1643824 RepID=UPI00034E5605|nr:MULTISPECIES: HAD hydrolase-like protein [Atopobiaceae]EPD77892.1 phosphoglycolate phosphatase [Atopobium sp. oral taxon 199 str. F0494]